MHNQPVYPRKPLHFGMELMHIHRCPVGSEHLPNQVNIGRRKRGQALRGIHRHSHSVPLHFHQLDERYERMIGLKVGRCGGFSVEMGLTDLIRTRPHQSHSVLPGSQVSRYMCSRYLGHCRRHRFDTGSTDTRRDFPHSLPLKGSTRV